MKIKDVKLFTYSFWCSWLKGKMKNKSHNIGIIAFGSLIDDPGEELEPFIIKKIKNVDTPFKIEYGRKSSKRGNAPTLIPTSKGGQIVKATLLVLSNELELWEAKNLLYRRELNKVGTDIKYRDRKNPNSNQLVIEEHRNVKHVDVALTANFGCNLPEISPEILADLAIESFNSNVVENGRDGISYLNNNIANGIITPMTEEYENAILQKMDANSLTEILERDGLDFNS